MKKRIILSGLGIAGLAWALAVGLSGASAADEVPREVAQRGPTAVRVGAVDHDAGQAERRFSGSLRAAARGQLAFTIAGRLDARPVELGDSVDAGDVLAQLDREPLRNRVRSAAAQLARARAEVARAARHHRRAQTLQASEAVAFAEVEDTLSDVDVLEATRSAAAVDLDEARRLLGEATLRAPFDAVVTQVLYQPGEYVPAGTPAIVLSGRGDLELEVEVSEDLLPDIPVGAAVRVELPRLDGRSVPASVVAIGHAAPERGRLFPVLVRVADDEDLVPGLSAELVVPVRDADATTIPIEAVVDPGGMHPAVFVVRDGVIARVELDVVRVRGSRAVVLGELVAGESVVVGGQSGLVPGETVTVIP
jgi:RND family efflux transporter MFP subunit